MINVEISLFGAFRAFDNGTPIILQLPVGTSLQETKQALGTELIRRFPDFKQDKLLEQSPLANEREILRADYILSKNEDLVILPPVSGG
jgi:molybdopterin synthase sulfur carrier subunit